MDSKRIIPKTKLRYFYQSLRSSEFNQVHRQVKICDNLIRNPDCLISLYADACNDFSRYSNVEEPFVPEEDKRKPLKRTKRVVKTENLLALFEIQRGLKVVRNSALDFKYIEREINPLRTTKTIFETGVSGRRSGIGGLDFIGINNEHNPVLGEVKIRTDENVFFAFIQLLTYCSELFTNNQIKRIIGHSVFGEHKIKPSCCLYIALYECNPKSATYPLIEKTLKLAKSFKALLGTEKNLNRFQEIGKITCLDTIVQNGNVSFKTCWEV
jgi:hypothetical protein